MFASDINSLNGCQKQPNPDHAVWGDVRRPAPGSIMRQGLRLVMLVLFVACGLALAGSKISGDLQKKLAAGGNIEVIVQFNHVPTSVDLQPFATHQIIRKFKHIKALHLLLTPAQIQALQLNPEITYITPNRDVLGTLDVTTQTVGANTAWSEGWNGTGVGVAVIDSGIYAHDDLTTASGSGSRIVYSQSFVSGLTGTDLYGHGTHVAGIIGSNGKDSTGAGLHAHV